MEILRYLHRIYKIPRIIAKETCNVVLILLFSVAGVLRFLQLQHGSIIQAIILWKFVIHRYKHVCRNCSENIQGHAVPSCTRSSSRNIRWLRGWTPVHTITLIQKICKPVKNYVRSEPINIPLKMYYCALFKKAMQCNICSLTNFVSLWLSSYRDAKCF